MTPDEFRQHGHQVIDWLADYLATLADRPVQATTRPGAIAAALPAEPPEQPEPFADVLADLDRLDPAGPVALAASALLWLLSGQRRTRRHSWRPGQHRAWRARPVLAVLPGADGGRGGYHRLGAPHGRLVRCLEGGDSGHRFHVHARRPDDCPGTHNWLCAGPWWVAGGTADRWQSMSRRRATPRSTRRRCLPASGATMSA